MVDVIELIFDVVAAIILIIINVYNLYSIQSVRRMIIERHLLKPYDVEKYFKETNVSFLRGHQRIMYGNDMHLLITRTEPGEKDSRRPTTMYSIEDMTGTSEVLTISLNQVSGRPSNGCIREEVSNFWILPSKREIHQIGDSWWIVTTSTKE